MINLWRQATHSKYIPFSSLQQVERLICPSSQGDLPAINAPQIEPQWIHLFQQKAAQPKTLGYATCGTHVYIGCLLTQLLQAFLFITVR
jgi:hypothetical protein